MNKYIRFTKQWLVPPEIWKNLAKIVNSNRKKVSQINEKDKNLLKKNIQLKDRYSDSRCFILGAGSSIKKQDLGLLAGEHVISVSNTFVHPEFSQIAPKFHVLPSLLKSHGMLHTEEKFVKWLQAMEKATGTAEMIMHIGDREMVEKNDLFKDRGIYWFEHSDSWNEDFNTPIDLSAVPPIWSVSEVAITVAIYLGFEKIYLVGFDHDWFNGLYVYFFDPAKEHILQPDEKKVDYVDSEFQMRRHAYIFRKYKYLFSIKNNIYNANADPNHYLDVFPKVDFDSLFEKRNS